MSNKQSSVEYLIEYLLPKALTVEQYYHIEKAKSMHKEEIETCMGVAYIDGLRYTDEKYISPYEDFEQYYNETYGGGNK